MSKTITLAAADLSTGETAKLRECSFTDTAGEPQTVKVLATAKMDIGGGIPSGCSQIDVTLYALQFKIKAKLNYKTVEAVTTYYGLSGWTIENYTSSEKRLLLQVAEPSTGTYTLDFAKGYLKT